jgi:hypothetical protein
MDGADIDLVLWTHRNTRKCSSKLKGTIREGLIYTGGSNLITSWMSGRWQGSISQHFSIKFHNASSNPRLTVSASIGRAGIKPDEHRTRTAHVFLISAQGCSPVSICNSRSRHQRSCVTGERTSSTVIPKEYTSEGVESDPVLSSNSGANQRYESDTPPLCVKDVPPLMSSSICPIISTSGGPD